MANVFIFSVEDVTTRAGYGDEAKGHELKALLPLTRDNGLIEHLKRIYPDGLCYPWGAIDRGNNHSTWDLMTEGDLVLGCRNGSILSAAHVLLKINDPSLASRIWNDSAGDPHRLLCFMDKPHLGEVPVVPQMMHYLDLDCPGFIKLHPEKRNNILRDYGSFEVFVRLGLRYDFPFSFRHSD